MPVPFPPIVDDPRIQRAFAFLAATDEVTLATQIELSEIPAPPFQERKRGLRLAELFEAEGLTDVRIDEVGNVLASAPGEDDGSALVVSAHLDTVFPEGTDVSVTREGDLLTGPGISDDARGLACMVAVVRALANARISTERPLLFAGTVGEEGIGDLRGVKHLFRSGGDGEGSSAFISLDGAGLDRIVVHGLGSRRYRITVRGPGGHSWVDWGTPNPLHALTRIGQRLTALPLSDDPRATLTLARTGGGTSINAIPQEAWLEVDTRSSVGAHLDGLQDQLRACVDQEVGRRPELHATIEVVGDRPGGHTAEDEALVQAALEATRHRGRIPQLALSSTDANVPMARGIPALTLGCGGDAGLAHTTDEWYRNVNGPDGPVRALHTILLYAGVAAIG
ncbi:MAG: M20/M25/M40 family metallo-hydrolase [Longimicrobiales bacterium]